MINIMFRSVQHILHTYAQKMYGSVRFSVSHGYEFSHKMLLQSMQCGRATRERYGQPKAQSKPLTKATRGKATIGEPASPL